MNLDQLQAFVQTVRQGSFSAAAQAIGLTQPAVTRQVQQLEREIGFTLLNRDQRPIAPTAAGRELLSCAETILSEWQNTVQRLGADSKELSGPLLVAASTIPGEFIVPALLARFTEQYPKVRPSLLITDSAGVAEELLARRAEVGFLGAPLVRPRLRLIPFSEDEIVLAVPTEHPMANKKSLPLAELTGQAFVEREGGSGTLESLKRLLAEKGLRLPEHRVAMVVGTTQSQLAAIEAGVGIGFVSSLALNGRPNLRVAALEIEGVKLRRVLYLAHEQAQLSAAAQAFVRFVEKPLDKSL